jgi:hypothetical protein
MRDLKELYYKVWPGKDSLKSSEYLVAENKVKVGKIDGHDAFVTYIYNHFNPFYGEDYIVFNVVYDYKIIETDSDYRYDKWNFTYINEMEIKSGEHEVSDYVDGSFKSPRKIKVDFFINYKQLVYDEMSKASSIEISKRYKELSDVINKRMNVKDFGREYQIIYKERDFISSKYLNAESIRLDDTQKEIDELKNMTDEEYSQKRKQEEKVWRDIMKDLDFNNESKLITKYSKFLKVVK